MDIQKKRRAKISVFAWHFLKKFLMECNILSGRADNWKIDAYPAGFNAHLIFNVRKASKLSIHDIFWYSPFKQ